MRTLIIVPPFYRLRGGRNNWVSLGAGYVATMLDDCGYEVKVYNADHVECDVDINLKEIFDGASLRQNLAEDDPIWDEIRERIVDYCPDIVGISATFVTNIPIINKIARIIKAWNPKCKIVVGGNNTVLMPKETMTEDIDYMIRGEGERPMMELVAGVSLPSIDGLSYRYNGKVYYNQENPFIRNLDNISFLKLELQLIPIKDPENNFGVLCTSRGCPFSCTFCSSPVLWKRKVRYRSVKNVVDEIKYRYAKWGVQKYYISDDNFNLPPKRTLELCKQMQELPFRIQWICEAQLSTFSELILEEMKKAGCVRVKLGVESGSERVLKLMNKPFTKDKIREKVGLVKKVGIPCTMYALIGMPTETVKEMQETYEFMKELDPRYISLSVAAPQPGTPLYEQAKKEGLLKDFSEKSHQSYHSTLNKNVSKEIVDKFLDFNAKKNYARSIWEEDDKT